MRFTKMQGLGNDYVYINGFTEIVNEPSILAVRISHRHFGIGSDGLVLILPSRVADFRMRMFNADGSESEMCGNAIRCVGKYVYDNKMTTQTFITVETLAGIKRLQMDIENQNVKLVKVDMGEPILEPKHIPVISSSESFISQAIEVDQIQYEITCVSMGNPHAVMYVSNTETFPLLKVGPKLEHHLLFPNRINVEVVEVINSKTLKMRVWERGAGETMACGTGACAALVSSVLNGYSERRATLELLGGNLEIEWNKFDNHVYMTGPATKVFDGEISFE